MPLARSVIARRPNAPARPWYSANRDRTTSSELCNADASRPSVMTRRSRAWQRRGCRLRDGPADEFERVFGALADDHNRGVGADGSRGRGDFTEARVALAEAGHGVRDLFESMPLPV
jgi:hypothetical protein